MREDSGNRFSDREERRNDRWERRREHWEGRRDRWENRSKHSHIWTGAFIVLIGIVALVKVSNPDLPHWVFTWKTFLIGLGLFTGFKHGFKGSSWFILMIIGGAFLLTDINPDLSF